MPELGVNKKRTNANIWGALQGAQNLKAPCKAPQYSLCGGVVFLTTPTLITNNYKKSGTERIIGSLLRQKNRHTRAFRIFSAGFCLIGTLTKKHSATSMLGALQGAPTVRASFLHLKHLDEVRVPRSMLSGGYEVDDTEHKGYTGEAEIIILPP